mgnify:FL=1
MKKEDIIKNKINKIEKIGLKENLNKSRVDLVLPESILGMGEVLAYGVKKYKPNSWQNVDDAINVHYAALMRHLLDWKIGKIYDTESGFSHIKHVLTNAMFLLYHEETKLNIKKLK